MLTQCTRFVSAHGRAGLQISTKKRGPISAQCRCDEPDNKDTKACPEGPASKDCSRDLDDVTKNYKDKEASGPGAPSLKACGPGDVAGGTTCSGLAFAKTRRRARRSGGSGGSVPLSGNVEFEFGVFPHEALVNEPGHALSTLHVGLRFELPTATSPPPSVACSFVVTAMDYAGQPFSNASLVAGSGAVAAQVSGTEGACDFVVPRGKYSRFATTALDEALDPAHVAMPAHEMAYMLEVTASAYVKDGGGGPGQVFKATHRKLICTPDFATRGTVVCGPGGARLVPPRGSSPRSPTSCPRPASERAL